MIIQKVLNDAIREHQNGKLENAERLYRSIIKFQPFHPDANHNLGVIFATLNKGVNALTFFETALKADQKIEQFWISYIKALIIEKQFKKAKKVLVDAQKFGVNKDKLKSFFLEMRLGNKSELSQKKLKLLNYFQSDQLDSAENLALTLIKDFPEDQFIWKALGTILIKRKKYDRALVAFDKAIEIFPNDFETHNNLSLLLLELEMLDEAENSCKTAIRLKPNSAEAYFNLAHTFQKKDRLKEAKYYYTKALSYRNNYISALYNLSLIDDCMNNVSLSIISLKKILNDDNNNIELQAKVSLAIYSYLNGNIKESERYLHLSTEIRNRQNVELKNEKIYYEYLLKLINWHKHKKIFDCKQNNYERLFIIGESHSLVAHQLKINFLNKDLICSSNLIKGCMQWHLGNSSENKYKLKFEKIFSSLTKNSNVLLTFGEIDCRLDSGILKHLEKHPEKDEKNLIKKTISNFLSYINKLNLVKKCDIIIQGIPCPNIKVNFKDNKIEKLINLIKNFDDELKKQTVEAGYKFLDLHELTNRGDGFSNSIHHIDEYHLTPEGFLEAWKRNFS